MFPKPSDIQASLLNSALPAGYSLLGLRSGISSTPGKKDLALFYSHTLAQCAAVFTRNKVKAAPVLLSQKKIQKSSQTRSILINSGCANACTGKQGMQDALWSVDQLAAKLRIPPAQILAASTGLIGSFLPRDDVRKGIGGLAGLLKEGRNSAHNAASAIMTTDTREKAAHAVFSWEGQKYTVWGCAKGSGMIHPNMGTMLSVILTDIGLPADKIRPALQQAVNRTFNRISVDGDTSTNDTVFLLSNGAKASFSKAPSKLMSLFQEALSQVCFSLSYQIVSDGEGATRTACVTVKNAAHEKSAARMAGTVAGSALVKTALHGADPNWGRIMAALGRADSPFDPDKVDIQFGDTVVFRKGRKTDFNVSKVNDVLQQKNVFIVIDLHQGKAEAHYLTCDFSKDYVTINADYST